MAFFSTRLFYHFSNLLTTFQSCLTQQCLVHNHTQTSNMWVTCYFHQNISSSRTVTYSTTTHIQPTISIMFQLRSPLMRGCNRNTNEHGMAGRTVPQLKLRASGQTADQRQDMRAQRRDGKKKTQHNAERAKTNASRKVNCCLLQEYAAKPHLIIQAEQDNDVLSCRNLGVHLQFVWSGSDQERKKTRNIFFAFLVLV